MICNFLVSENEEIFSELSVTDILDSCPFQRCLWWGHTRWDSDTATPHIPTTLKNTLSFQLWVLKDKAKVIFHAICGRKLYSWDHNDYFDTPIDLLQMPAYGMSFTDETRLISIMSKPISIVVVVVVVVVQKS